MKFTQGGTVFCFYITLSLYFKLDMSAVLDESVPSFRTFTLLSVRDVKQLIQNSALKSCPLDPMPSTLASKCVDLLPVLTKIVNNSLQSGCFPEIWKEALVFFTVKETRSRCHL